MAHSPPRHELSSAAIAAHGQLTYRVGWQARQYAQAVAKAMHALGHEVRVAADPDFPRWVEVTDADAGDVHARIKGA